MPIRLSSRPSSCDLNKPSFNEDRSKVLLGRGGGGGGTRFGSKGLCDSHREAGCQHIRIQNVRGLIKRYLDWVHFCNILRHAATVLLWDCLDMFLQVLQPFSLTKSSRFCVMLPVREVREHGAKGVYRTVSKSRANRGWNLLNVLKLPFESRQQTARQILVLPPEVYASVHRQVTVSY